MQTCRVYCAAYANKACRANIALANDFVQNSLVIFKDCSTKVSVTQAKEPVGDQLQATLQPFGEYSLSTNQSLGLCNWTLKNKLYFYIE